MTGTAANEQVARIAHDQDAFETFYRRYVEAIQRFVARRVEDPYRVADLTAEVFLAAIDSAHSYRSSRGEPAGWLYGVARNVVASDRRRNARELRVARRVAGRALVDDDDIARLEERIVAEQHARELYVAMDKLSERERAVLELVALEGLAVQDVAKALGITRGATRVRLHRARRLMRHELAALVTEGPAQLATEGIV